MVAENKGVEPILTKDNWEAHKSNGIIQKIE